ncbi:hypothetical protein H6B11_09510 [Mediterraneibacter glycyrrhizinilyticus]|nr:putative ABC transporter permease [Mediterraneibacter glycyrrhizinilyticus]MBM6854393.1 hypothetical protein [Mediterraneibacter glycyrrhizinilyticus]
MQSYYLSQWIIFFFIYSFVGWIWESCYVSAKKRRWVNRGFMHGPLLPLYGSGAVVILIFTISVRGNGVLVFFLGMFAATVLEYFTGTAMERLFHVRYWDYRNVKFNLNGYICPAASFCWGCFSVLMTEVVHPPVEQVVLDIPLNITEYAALILSIVAAVDFTQSFNEAMDMRNILTQLEESRRQIRKMQERLKVSAEGIAEDYRKRSEEMLQTVSGQRALLLAGIRERRELQKKLLEELASRADFLLKEELPSKVDELIGEERRRELSEIRDSIYREFQKMGERTDRHYLHAASLLRRNPTAVSDRFKEAIDELRRMSEEGKWIPERETEVAEESEISGEFESTEEVENAGGYETTQGHENAGSDENRDNSEGDSR